MSSPLLQPLTVLFVSPNDRLRTGDRPLTDADAAIDVRTVDSLPDAVAGSDAEDLGGGAIDAVVCEHRPPAVDGVAAVAAVRERDDDLPVLVVPGATDADCTEAALAAGATDVVQTPLSSLPPSVLANRIRQFVRAGDPARAARTSSARPPGPAVERGRAGPTVESQPSTDRLDRIHDGIEALRDTGRKDVVADVLVDVTADVLDAPGVGVFLFDDGDNCLRPAAITEHMERYYGGDAVFGPGRPDSITWQVFVTGKPQGFEDVRTSDALVNEDTDARSSRFVPLGEHGVLVVATDEVGAFGADGRRAVDLLAASAETTLDRIESSAALRRRDRRLRERDDRLGYLDRVVRMVTAVEEAVVAAETREGLESAVLERLVDAGELEFAWIGTVDGETGRLCPREWAGDGGQYLDDVSLDVDGCAEPSCRTARRWRATNAPNVAASLDGDGWERAALAREFHSVLSVPLVYDGVRYGVLTAYADYPGAFGDHVTSVVEQVGEATAHAINAIERELSTLSNGVAELDIEIPDPDDALNAIAAGIGTTVECRRLTPLADGSTKLLFAAGGVSVESVLTVTSGLVAVESVTHVAGDDDDLFTAVVEGETVGSVIAASGGTLTNLTADRTSLTATVTVPDVIEARTFVDRLRRRYPDTELLARRERDESEITRRAFLDQLESALTDRQLEVLRTAHDLGFFRSPRDATGQDVADRLGVSQPTVSHHLRAGEGTLFSLLFGEPGPDGPSS